MSYDSDFKVSIKGLSKGFSCIHKDYPENASFCPYCGTKIGSIDSIEDTLEEISKYSFYRVYDNDLTLTSSSWYAWKDNMIELSKQFDCLFTVLREGEDSLDIEKCYFYKGKSFSPGKVIITFENDTDEKRKEVLGI